MNGLSYEDCCDEVCPSLLPCRERKKLWTSSLASLEALQRNTNQLDTLQILAHMAKGDRHSRKGAKNFGMTRIMPHFDAILFYMHSNASVPVDPCDS